MIKKILTITITISALTLTAQDEIDALRYSTQDLIGTARYTSLGGAFGSLGGEFSGLSSNPAGIGMFQYSEVTFTPYTNLNSNRSYYNNTYKDAYRSELSLGNLGLVLNIPQSTTNWKRINIGIGWNQLANYNNAIKIEEQNNSSIVDQIIDITNGTLISDIQNERGNYISEMAWYTYLIHPLLDTSNNIIDGQYVSNFSSNHKSQRKIMTSNGGINEFVLSIGGSYKEKIYLGATIGIPNLNYYEYSEYIEAEISDTSNNLQRMFFSEERAVYGTGYNLKIGAIYRLSENTKIGGALHTPTFFNIEEAYNTNITTSFKDSSRSYTMGYFNPINYNLITPLKASISASTIFNNFMISAEYEMIDYSTAEYLNTDFEVENRTIENDYQQTENVKLGVEMNMKPIMFRVGYSKYGSPFATKDFSRENFSYGVGVNNSSYFIDVAYVLSQSSNQYKLYGDDYINPTDLTNTNHSLLFTIGFRY